MKYGDVEVTRERPCGGRRNSTRPQQFLRRAAHQLAGRCVRCARRRYANAAHRCCARRANTSAPARTSPIARSRRNATTRREQDGNPLYSAAVRLFGAKKPIVGAINGSAVGGGFGLALLPDFRVASPETRFTANFVKLGFHPGFGLTYTLPRLIGQQRANLMFYTGRRIDGETAHAWGLADVLTDQESLRDEAMKLASRNRRKRAAGGDVGARDDARGARGRGESADRSRVHRTTSAAADRRPQGRRSRRCRAAARQLQGQLTATPTAPPRS